MKAVHSIVLIACAVALAACDRLPIPDPNRAAAQKELEAKAIGGACRHAGRALEDCYTLNPKASKAAIFAGWREMNDYMTQNKIEVVLPTVSPKNARKLKPVEAETVADEAMADEAPAAKEAHGNRNPALTAG
ncbi:MAG: hypothetical protein RBS46_14870 [Methyloversatilis sp.]|nr:hypothetical protein [Methyloversatilis sp.]